MRDKDNKKDINLNLNNNNKEESSNKDTENKDITISNNNNLRNTGKIEVKIFLPDETESIENIGEIFENSTQTISYSQENSELEDYGIKETKKIEENIYEIIESERYKILQILGKGGMGVVYLVEDNILKRNVALKVLKPGKAYNLATKEKFIKEARITAQLEHPNVVPIYDLNLKERDIYFTMKVVKGTTLSQIIEGLKNRDKKFEKYSRIRLLQILINVCYAVEYAHSKNIIHRDLKPSNIMIREFGEVFVLDWGLAKNIKEEKDKNKGEVLEEPELVGTPLYMAPEQANGLSNLDERVDIYSLGAILYEILTYQQLYNADTIITLFNKILTEEPKWRKYNELGEYIPPEILAVAMKALVKDREKRYRTVKEFRRDIQRFIEGKSVSVYPDSPVEKFIKLVRRNIEVSIVTTIFLFIFLISYHFCKLRSYYYKIQQELLYNNWLKIAEKHHNRVRKLNKKREDLIIRIQKSNKIGTYNKKLFNYLNNIKKNIEKEKRYAESYYDHILKSKELIEIREKLALLYLEEAKLLLRVLNNLYSKEKIEKIKRLIKKACNIYPNFKDKCKKLLDKLSNQLIKIYLHSNKIIKVDLYKLNYYYKKMTFSYNFLKNIQINKKILLDLNPGTYILKIDKYRIIYPFYIFKKKKYEFFINIPKNIIKNMVYIPGGEYLRGEKLLSYKKVFPFFIDKTEVTIKEYLEFFKDNPYKRNLPKIYILNKLETLWDSNYKLKFGLTPKCPIFGITYYSALEFCKWRSKKYGIEFDLPLPIEWEKAYRGVDGRIYCWGNKFIPNYANIQSAFSDESVKEVGSFPLDRTIYGVLDMAGNVSEWVKTLNLRNKAYIKGGNCRSSYKYAKAFVINKVSPYTHSCIGFRCVYRRIKY